MTSKWTGITYALAAAVLFGATAPVSKVLLGSIDPWLLAGLLYLGAGGGMLIYQLVNRALGQQRQEAPLQKPDIPWVLAIILFGGVVGPVVMMLGLSQTAAASTSLLLNLESIATMAIAWLVFRENVDRRLLVGAFAILAGALLLSWNGNAIAFDAGSALIAVACLAWAIDNNLTRKLSSADPLQLVTIKGLAAGTVNTVIALWSGAGVPTMSVGLACAIVGFFSVGISLVCFMLGLRHLGAARTGAYFSIAPFFGAALAIVLLGEPLSFKLVTAALLMALGLWLHLSERHEHEHIHEELEHEHAHDHDVHHAHSHDGQITAHHSHWHRHEPIRHKHPHYPDVHHRHSHG